MPSLRGAFRREGSKGVLGVFTPGEEILSIKTGEAGRYQALKKRLGINPLAKIGNFAQGGTIDIAANVTSGFSNQRPTFDLSGLSRVNSSSLTTTKIVNLNQTVVTPNADSFNLNQDQRNQDLLESLRRGV